MWPRTPVPSGMFDNRFFGTSPAAEAGVMDPLQRLLIERRYEAEALHMGHWCCVIWAATLRKDDTLDGQRHGRVCTRSLHSKAWVPHMSSLEALLSPLPRLGSGGLILN